MSGDRLIVLGKCVEQDIPAGFGLALADEQGLRCGVRFGVELNIQPPTMRLALGEFLPFRKSGRTEMIHLRVQNPKELFRMSRPV